MLIALVFLYDLLHVHEEGKKDWVFSSIYSIAGLFLFVAGIFNKKLFHNLSQQLALLLFESVLIISGAVYFWSKGASLVAASHAILAGAIILFWIYLKKREYGENIVVSEHSIVLPGLSGTRIVEWHQLSNVIKKDDLLTLDFKNNKLLQVDIRLRTLSSENQGLHTYFILTAKEIFLKTLPCSQRADVGGMLSGCPAMNG